MLFSSMFAAIFVLFSISYCLVLAQEDAIPVIILPTKLWLA